MKLSDISKMIDEMFVNRPISMPGPRSDGETIRFPVLPKFPIATGADNAEVPKKSFDYTTSNLVISDLSDIRFPLLSQEMTDYLAREAAAACDSMTTLMLLQQAETASSRRPKPVSPPTDDRLATLRYWLEMCEIGEPIKTWLQPRLSINPAWNYRSDHLPLNLHLWIRALHADRPGRHIDLSATYSIHPDIDTAEVFLEFVHDKLMDVLRHELGEAIRVHGRKPFDPHRDGR